MSFTIHIAVEEAVLLVSRSKQRIETALELLPLTNVVGVVSQLIRDNRQLFFWASNGIMCLVAPLPFIIGICGGGALAATQAAPKPPKRIKPIDWENTKSVIGAIMLISSYLLHQILQCFGSGCMAGYRLYRVWRGECNPLGLSGLRALEYEMHETGQQLTGWHPPRHSTLA